VTARLMVVQSLAVTVVPPNLLHVTKTLAQYQKNPKCRSYKGHVKGKVMHSTSPFRVTLPTELIIRTPEGTSATEYQLLRLYRKGNRREFRAMTGGVFHASGGAERTTVEFNPEKIAPRTWKVQLDHLEAGEYGFLPPGVSAASISSSGKMYTFGVIE